MASSMRNISSIFKSNLYGIKTKSKICSRLVQSTVGDKEDLSCYDPVQVKLLDEMCIAVDENDKVTGPRTKKECHLMENIREGLLHRAFSVLLFNSKGELLLQQRSDEKITFPGQFTNTCCSHPLYNDSELEEIEALGVKRAAKRRMCIELGVTPDSINYHEFQYMTRFKYTAHFDEKWGENELAYLLFLQKEIGINPNPNEVKDYIYLSQANLKPFLENQEKKGYKITPWFKLISEKLLPQYWNNLDKLKSLCDHKTIHDFH